MKYKILFISILISIFLTGCDILMEDQILFKLNPGVDTVEIHTSFTDAGAKATIGIQKIDVQAIENTVDISTIGTYKIVYEAIYNDTSYYLTRVVDVIDETPPLISLNSGVDTIKVNQSWIDTGISVTDNSLEECKINVIGSVNNYIVGEYEIVYIAIDSSNNESRISRFVNVIE